MERKGEGMIPEKILSRYVGEDNASSSLRLYGTVVATVASMLKNADVFFTGWRGWVCSAGAGFSLSGR